jgi:hypothetical protein
MEGRAKDAEVVSGGTRDLLCAKGVQTIQILKEIKQVRMFHKFPKRRGEDELPTGRATAGRRGRSSIADCGLRI